VSYDATVAGALEAGVLLDEPAVVAIRRIARAQTADVRAAWYDLAAADRFDRSSEGAAAEALHDFRVALRSLRSWLRAHDDALHVPKKVRRRLRRAAHVTNESRDAEVLAALLAGLPGMTRAGVASSRWWRERLSERAQDPEVISRLRDDIQRGVDALDEQLSVVRWQQPVDSPWSFAPLAADLAVRVRSHRDELAVALARIDYPSREVTVHRARIAAKRVRYLLEPVKGGVPEARSAVKLLKSMQDDFGDLHDLHVARGALDRGVIERAEHEANERSRAILDAADEGRAPRRIASKLVGFSSVAAAVREEEHARFKAIETRWLHDSAASLLAAVDAAIVTLARRGGGTGIERKYLLSAEPTVPDESVRDVVEIEQGYLPGDRVTERLRREYHADGSIRLRRTLKLSRGLVRTELDEDISPELFDVLWPATIARRVRKQRTKASTGINMVTIDVFRDRPLVLAEVNIEQINDPVDLPHWLLEVLVAEVTDDASYSNARLARPDLDETRRI
jgi:CHAD domain-containing protein/CYTH domain-containing protein